MFQGECSLCLVKALFALVLILVRIREVSDYSASYFFCDYCVCTCRWLPCCAPTKAQKRGNRRLIQNGCWRKNPMTLHHRFLMLAAIIRSRIVLNKQRCKTRGKKRFQVRPHLKERKRHGQFHALFHELRMLDREYCNSPSFMYTFFLALLSLATFRQSNCLPFLR